MKNTEKEDIKRIYNEIAEYLTEFAETHNAVKVGELHKSYEDHCGGLHVEFFAKFIEAGKYGSDCHYSIHGVGYLSEFRGHVWIDILDYNEKWLHKTAETVAL